MDRARNKTDKRLAKLERRVTRLYAESPSLSRMQKEFKEYMTEVKAQTADLYDAYVNAEPDTKAEAKDAYTAEVKRLTVQNKHYKKLVKKIAAAMAHVNQEALAMINAEMVDVYATNYNAIAADCRKVGIKVHAKE